MAEFLTRKMPIHENCLPVAKIEKRQSSIFKNNVMNPRNFEYLRYKNEISWNYCIKHVHRYLNSIFKYFKAESMSLRSKSKCYHFRQELSK